MKAVRRLGVALLLSALCLGPSLVPAQESQNPEPTAPPSTQNAPAHAAPAHGQSEEDETAQFKNSGSIRFISRLTGLSSNGAYWAAVATNFVIVVAVIAWASRKNLPAIFRNRTAAIQKSIEEARSASEEARRRITDIESRLGRLDSEISAMRATSEKEAIAEEARIKAATDEELRRIVESAEQEIDAAVKAARRELTTYAADLAVDLAARQIRVDGATDQALVRKFSQHLSNGASGKRA
jgi:F-type H+-transporting ATPase subunit b